MAESVECYVDPLSPWGFRATCWLRSARAVRPLEVRWGLLSLAELNPNVDDEARKGRYLASRETQRVLVQAEREGGQEAMATMLYELAKARYERAVNLADPEVIAAAAGAAGLPAGIRNRAVDDPSTSEWIGEEHRRLAALGAFGIPTLIFAGAQPLFGPVLNSIPQGEEAGSLLDHVAWLARREDFSELKRNRVPFAAPSPR